jgi:hypothetical protein
MTAARAIRQSFIRRSVPTPISSSVLRTGRRYIAANGEVREIVGFDGGYITYVIGHRGLFPVWDKRRWQSTTRLQFASEVIREFKTS